MAKTVFCQTETADCPWTLRWQHPFIAPVVEGLEMQTLLVGRALTTLISWSKKHRDPYLRLVKGNFGQPDG